MTTAGTDRRSTLLLRPVPHRNQLTGLPDRRVLERRIQKAFEQERTIVVAYCRALTASAAVWGELLAPFLGVFPFRLKIGVSRPGRKGAAADLLGQADVAVSSAS